MKLGWPLGPSSERSTPTRSHWQHAQSRLNSAPPLYRLAFGPLVPRASTENGHHGAGAKSLGLWSESQSPKVRGQPYKHAVLQSRRALDTPLLIGVPEGGHGSLFSSGQYCSQVNRSQRMRDWASAGTACRYTRKKNIRLPAPTFTMRLHEVC